MFRTFFTLADRHWLITAHAENLTALFTREADGENSAFDTSLQYENMDYI